MEATGTVVTSSGIAVAAASSSAKGIGSETKRSTSVPRKASLHREKTVIPWSSIQRARMAGSAKSAALHRGFGGEPKCLENAHGGEEVSRFESDHEIEIDGEPGIALQNDRYPADDDKTHLGGDQGRQDRLDRTRCHPLSVPEGMLRGFAESTRSGFGGGRREVAGGADRVEALVVRAVAERLALRAATAAEGDDRAAAEAERPALLVDELDTLRLRPSMSRCCGP